VADFEVEMTPEQTLFSTWNSTLAVDGPRRLPKTKAAVHTISKINASSRRYRAPTCSYILIRLMGRGPVSDYQTSSCTPPFELSFSTGGYHKICSGVAWFSPIASISVKTPGTPRSGWEPLYRTEAPSRD
jgi:hypothetical protein